MELQRPYSTVKEIIGKVSSDGEIRGTSEFAKETFLSGAISTRSCSFFREGSEGGEAFYKIRSGTLAPVHFSGSSDTGTVAVRYIIEPLGPASTRLRIDAVFAEDSHHASYVSDGSVEAAEFEEIDARLLLLDTHVNQQHAAAHHRALETQRKDLQGSLEMEQAQLQTTSASVEDLEKRAALLRTKTLARVKTDSTSLLSAPFIRAESLALLHKHEELVVLLRTPYWIRVRTTDAKEGWVYHLLVEPAQ
jgi:hypothetical protein